MVIPRINKEIARSTVKAYLDAETSKKLKSLKEDLDNQIKLTLAEVGGSDYIQLITKYDNKWLKTQYRFCFIKGGLVVWVNCSPIPYFTDRVVISSERMAEIKAIQTKIESYSEGIESLKSELIALLLKYRTFKVISKNFPDIVSYLPEEFVNGDKSNLPSLDVGNLLGKLKTLNS